MTWESSLPALWMEFGGEALVNLSDVVFAGLTDCDLRFLFRNGERQVLTCKTAEVAKGHYGYVRTALGFQKEGAL